LSQTSGAKKKKKNQKKKKQNTTKKKKKRKKKKKTQTKGCGGGICPSVLTAGRDRKNNIAQSEGETVFFHFIEKPKKVRKRFKENQRIFIGGKYDNEIDRRDETKSHFCTLEEREARMKAPERKFFEPPARNFGW